MCDIYSLSVNLRKYFINTGIDINNILFVSRESIKKKGVSLADEEMVCQECNKTSLFLHNIDDKYICPKCSIKYNWNKCNHCYFKLGCDCCGGNSKQMINTWHHEYSDKMLLLCNDDKCLMQFGLCTNYRKDPNCTCIMEAYESFDLDKDTKSVLSSYMFNGKRTEPVNNTKYKFPDLHVQKKCIPCSIDNMYTRVIYRGNVSKCNCYSC